MAVQPKNRHEDANRHYLPVAFRNCQPKWTEPVRNWIPDIFCPVNPNRRNSIRVNVWYTDQHRNNILRHQHILYTLLKVTLWSAECVALPFWNYSSQTARLLFAPLTNLAKYCSLWTRISRLRSSSFKFVSLSILFGQICFFIPIIVSYVKRYYYNAAGPPIRALPTANKKSSFLKRLRRRFSLDFLPR